MCRVQREVKNIPAGHRNSFLLPYFFPAPSEVSGEPPRIKRRVLVVGDEILGRDEVAQLKVKSSQRLKFLGWRLERREPEEEIKHELDHYMCDLEEEATPRFSRSHWAKWGEYARREIVHGVGRKKSVRVLGKRKRTAESIGYSGPVMTTGTGNLSWLERRGLDPWDVLEGPLIYQPVRYGRECVGFDSHPVHNDRAWVLPSVAPLTVESRVVPNVYVEPMYFRQSGVVASPLDGVL
jgi:hypothetical protein